MLHKYMRHNIAPLKYKFVVMSYSRQWMLRSVEEFLSLRQGHKLCLKSFQYLASTADQV